jgi:hypothetical protein
MDSRYAAGRGEVSRSGGRLLIAIDDAMRTDGGARLAAVGRGMSRA